MDYRIVKRKLMNTPKIKYNILLTLLLLSQLTHAQNDPFFNDNVTDVPAASIDNWVFPMFIIGGLLMFKYFNKHKIKMIKTIKTIKVNS